MKLTPTGGSDEIHLTPHDAFLHSDERGVQPDSGGCLSVPINAFGGAVTGKLCWLHPNGQLKTNANWPELVSVEAGAAVLAGGARLDFELQFDGNDIIIGSKGTIVLGPGAKAALALKSTCRICGACAKL